MARAASDMVRGREAEEQAAELAALLRLMEISAGTFSLSMAVCNSPALRDYLIGRVQDVHPKLLVVRLPKGCVDVYGEVTACVNGANVGAIFVTGIEHSVSSELREYPALKSLNASRDLWEPRFPCPVVFWMPTYVAALIPLQAPDLWRYRSHGFEFVSPERESELAIGEEFGGGLSLSRNLNADQKRFRIAELEQRMEDLGWPPPENLFQHALLYLSELAFLYARVGEAERGEALIRKAIDVCVERNWTRGMAVQYANLGNIAALRGNLDAAEEHYRKALDLNEREGRLEGKAANLLNLGSLERMRGKLDTAESLFKKVLELDRRAGLLERRSTVLGNLGLILAARGDLDAACQYFKEALDLDMGSGQLEGQAIHFGNLGTVAGARGDLDAAEVFYRKALEVDKVLGRLDGCAVDLWNLGRIAQKRGDIGAARRLWGESRDLYSDLGIVDSAEELKSMLEDLPPE